MPEYPDETALHRLRQEETALGSAETVYLDYAASPPLLTSTIGAFHKAACATLYANPHSRSPASEATTLSIDTVRHQLLIQLLGLDSVQAASEWDVIFTSGATAAAKLLAQHFDWRPRDGAFAYLANATHTSVVGIREAALQHGSSVHPTSLHGLCRFSQPSASAPVLFAYPSQCNATGRCFSLQLCRDIKSANPDENYVLVDAAASLATSSLDLSAIPLEQQPDFVIWSAYKTYGWPTGLGCLFVKRSSGIRVLKRRGYFGGGTMDSMSVYAPFTSRPPSEALLHRTFEDGTLPFLDIVALNSVMQHHTSLFASSLSSDLVGQHARTLTHMAMERMSQIKHGNGQPLCRIYDASFFGEIDSPYITVHGTAVAFTLFDSANQPIGHVELDKLAAVNNIHIRTGGLCNIGAVSRAIGLSDEDLLHHATKLCWDEQEFLDPDSTHRRPTGISRISFGALSTLSDVDRWLTFLEKFFLAPTESTTAETPLQKAVYELQDLSIYPIKSCAAMQIPKGQSWSLGSAGLQFDREWMICDRRTGSALSQKRWTKMACIRPHLDVEAQTLLISIPTFEDFTLSLQQSPAAEASCSSNKVCADAVKTIRHSTDELDHALSQWIGVACTLQRSLASNSGRYAHFGGSSDRVPIALSNESPFLVINQASVNHLTQACQFKIHASAFRSNFVVKPVDHSLTPYQEDHWNTLRIGQQVFEVLSYCRRCQMINVDQKTGQKLKEPYNILNQTRRNARGHIRFGLHLFHRRDLSSEPFVLHQGASVVPA